MQNTLRRPRKTNRRFYISAANDISLVASELPSRSHDARFSSERELSAQAARWPASRLVQVWNRLPDVNPVKRFTDKQTATRRIWRAIQEGHVHQITRAQKLLASEARRSNTKTAQIINLLKRPAGVTLQAIMDLTGWQAHSVRGFLSAQVSKKRGLSVESLTWNGQRTYRIRTASL